MIVHMMPVAMEKPASCAAQCPGERATPRESGREGNRSGGKEGNRSLLFIDSAAPFLFIFSACITCNATILLPIQSMEGARGKERKNGGKKGHE
jgi:hypothetical protein